MAFDKQNFILGDNVAEPGFKLVVVASIVIIQKV